MEIAEDARGKATTDQYDRNNTRNHGNETKYGHHSPECAASVHNMYSYERSLKHVLYYEIFISVRC